MKLWILEARHDLSEGDNPWDPWYDKCFAMVVRAETEDDARSIADQNAEDENRKSYLNKSKEEHPWLNSAYSTCLELAAEGDEGVVIRDIATA